jgi:transposase
MYYIGLDVHKRKISYCVKDSSGKVHSEGSLSATRLDLSQWMKTLPQPWSAAMEATMFTGWIYDHLKPQAATLKVAHPLMLRAIAAAKKKNDRIDASKICDCLRCDFLPECYMASTEIRERRRTLRYRNLLVRQMVQTKNKIAVLLMEGGVSYNKQKLHQAGYFRELLASNPHIDEGVVFFAAFVPRDRRASAKNRECLGALPGTGFLTAGTCGAADDHPGGRSDHGADLGAGSGRCAAALVDQESDQLLWAMWSGKKQRQHCATHSRYWPARTNMKVNRNCPHRLHRTVIRLPFKKACGGSLQMQETRKLHASKLSRL